MNLIDIHAHLDFKDFDADRGEVIRLTRKADCGVINVGVDLPTSREVIKLAEENDLMWATVGFHPHDSEAGVPVSEDDWQALADLAKHPKVVAIGECGLDYFRLPAEAVVKDELIKKQKEIFERQIELALKVGKPLMLHVRDAYGEVLAILKKYPAARGNVHFFAGNQEQAQHFIDFGFTLSFTGVITFARDYDEVIKSVPIDKIMAETDAPLIAPVPYRGKRNEPLFVREVIKRLAELKEVSLATLAAQTVATARRVFNLPLH